MKWLNNIGESVGEAKQSASGAERNWSTHGFIFSDLRKSLSAKRLERYTRLYRNMRLRDRVRQRGAKAKKAAKAEPKPYPLIREGGVVLV